MRTKLIITSLVIVVAITATACGGLSSGTSAVSQSQPAQAGAPVSANCGVTVSQDQQNADRNVSRSPIRIVLFQDKTGSANDTRTVQLTEADFAAPIKLLRCTGGELGVGVVDDLSNRPLVRLRIDAPPAPPALPQARNVFQRAADDGDYQQRMKDYNDGVAKWTLETDRRVQAFLAQAGQLLKQKANAKKTNVWSAVARADLYLNESDATWPRPTHRYAVFNSDAVDTARSKAIELKSGAQLIVVNGVGSVGVLDSLKPDRFEAVQAAFDFIAAKELGGK